MPIHILLGSRNLRWPRAALEISSAPFVDIVYYKKGLLLVILTFTVLSWLFVSSSGCAPGCAETMEQRTLENFIFKLSTSLPVIAQSLNPDIKPSCSR